METMDPPVATPSGALASPSSTRNAGPIREVLARILPHDGRVLEVAAGSGQHAAAFAAAFPGLEWTPADPSPEARASIAAWAQAASLPNVQPPLALDAMDPTTWPDGSFDAILCINMIHISPWAATEGLMRLAQTRLKPGGMLYLYGPCRETDTPLAPSNAAFDESLKMRNPDWGLRDVDAVTDLAGACGLRFIERVEMPANNLSLIYQRQ